MEEFMDYICRLLRNGINITAITIERGFYVKINKNIWQREEMETFMGIQLFILRRPQYTYKEDFKIHYPHRE